MAEGSRWNLRVQPRARREEVLLLGHDALRVRVTEPPVEGRANKAVLEALARRLAVPVGAIRLLRGQGSRNKVVEVPLAREEVLRRLVG
ncbi:MAG: DUF167 domain-containing protein [Chloroflexi bacterium]|nr:DUF167 domain-containing protein [Chloroflexota bacterium]